MSHAMQCLAGTAPIWLILGGLVISEVRRWLKRDPEPPSASAEGAGFAAYLSGQEVRP